MFSYLDLSALTGGPFAACERLPQAPAIYAFFRKIRLVDSGSADDFIESLLAAISQPAAPLKSAKIGPLHRVELHSVSSLSPAKKNDLQAMAESQEFREFLARVVETASSLQAPLYVGKAGNLQSRILQHLEPMSDLNTRLRGEGVSLEKSVLSYAVIDDPDVVLTDNVLFLIEEIISRLCRPGFVGRIG